MKFIVRLETDRTISVSPPTPADTFPPGQPEVLLGKTLSLGAGPVLVWASFSASVSGPLDPQSANEYAPLLQFSLWCDGVEIPFARSTLNPYSPNAGPGPQLQSLNDAGTVTGVAELAQAGDHVFELRWGIQGKAPDANAWCLPEGSLFGTAYDHAVMIIEPVCVFG